MKIDVFIPAYHPPALVDQCLRSVARQTLPIESVTVVDDASPYDLSDLAARYPTVRFLRNDRNRGIGGNLNRCLELATAEVITFLHSDDLLASDWHAVWQRRLAEAPATADLFMSGSVIMDANGSPWMVHAFDRKPWCAAFPLNVRRLWRWKCYGVTFSASLLYRRRFFDRFGPFPCDRFPHNSDVELNLRGLIEGELFFTPELLFYFRRHGGQSVCQSDLQAAETARDIFCSVAARYQERLQEVGMDLLREPLAVYQILALVWRLKGDRGRWRRYRQIGAVGNPAGWLSPWMWGFAARLFHEYLRRWLLARRLAFEKGSLLP